MPTLLIHIAPRPGGTGPSYPVKLFTDAVAPPAGMNWYDLPAQVGSIPASGQAGTPPLTLPGGVILDPGSAVAAFATRPAQGVVRQIGEYLHDLVAGLGGAWAGNRAAGGIVRTIVDIEPDELASLPWEALRDPAKGEWLFHLPGQTLVHGPIDFTRAASPMRGLLRVLIVLGSPATEGGIHVGEELEGLQAVFRQVHPCIDWKVIDRPIQQVLQAELNTYEPDVLHFIGHGAMVKKTAILRFRGSPDGGPAWDWDAAVIRATFGGMPRPPRLAYFSACFSGATQGADSWSLGRAVLNVAPGVPGAMAAVTMQAGIAGPAAAVFAARFYQSLAVRFPVDLAAATARNEVITRLGLGDPDWAIPRLHLRVPPDQLFPFGWGLSPGLAQRFENDRRAATTPGSSYYARTLAHVDRREHRRALIVELEDFLRSPGSSPFNLLAITGLREVGKTDLAICTLACGLALGYRAVYIDLSRPKRPLDFYEVLCRIRDGGQEVRMMDPLPRAAFAEFDKLPPPGGAGNDNPVVALAQAFLGALTLFAAGPGPAILALDQFTGRNGAGVLPQEFQSLFVRHVLRPLAEGKVPNLLTLVVATDEEFDEERGLGLATLPARIPPCRIEPFQDHEFPELAAEYCLYSGYFQKNRVAARSILEGLKSIFDSSWQPWELRDVLDRSFRRPPTRIRS